MTVTVHIFPDEQLLLELPDDTETAITHNNSQLSVDERMALLEQVADLFMEFVGPDFQPLSDYAMSRESIYEGHPKL